MKNKLNIIAIALVSTSMLLTVSCSKSNPDEQKVIFLEVNASNLHGKWALATVNNAPVPEGAYFHINFNRSSEEFQIWNAMNSIPSSYDYSEGIFKLYQEPELGVYIRGIDSVGEEWNDLYVIKNLTQQSMIWVGVNDPTFIQTFTRITGDSVGR